MKSQSWLSVLLGLALAYLTIAQCGVPTASTLNGTYTGIHNNRYNVDAFLGIPYAQAPRYSQPLPFNTSWTGERNATEFGAQCVGYGSDTTSNPAPVSEDCLFLNVVRPSGFENEKLPVAIWIHGGNYQQGSNSDPRYNLTFIVQGSVEAGNPILGVSINYRLHTWGFLFSEEIRDEKVANLGLRDQRAAFAWVQENIAGFGGDPSKVTIWGESAGAGSVGAQLIAYNGRDDGLFRAAIAESGASISWGRYAPISTHQSLYNNITKATGCSNSTNTLSCLRALPFTTLNNVLNSSITTVAQLQYPVIDGDLILQSPTTQLLNGQFLKVPLLIGNNFDEGASFSSRSVNTNEQFRAYMTSVNFALGNTSSVLDTLEILYPDIPAIGIPATFKGRPAAAPAGLGLQYKRASAIIGDALMDAPRRFTNQIWAANNLSCYSYRFNVVPNGISYSSGSNHFQEVAFVMNNVEGVGYVSKGGQNPFEGKPPAFKELARLMTRMWSAFVFGLDPNDSGVPSVEWPVYEVDQGKNYVFDANVTGLGYVEEDLYRVEPIKYFMDNFVGLFGR